jgi:hypothetical protein
MDGKIKIFVNPGDKGMEHAVIGGRVREYKRHIIFLERVYSP